MDPIVQALDRLCVTAGQMESDTNSLALPTQVLFNVSLLHLAIIRVASMSRVKMLNPNMTQRAARKGHGWPNLFSHARYFDLYH